IKAGSPVPHSALSTSLPGPPGVNVNSISDLSTTSTKARATGRLLNAVKSSLLEALTSLLQLGIAAAQHTVISRSALSLTHQRLLRLAGREATLSRARVR